MSPTGRLYETDAGIPTTAVTEEILVWSEKRLDHCQKAAEGSDEIDIENEETPTLLVGTNLFDGAARPDQVAFAFKKTDRWRDPIPFTSADVHHLYHLQQSWAWQGPHRTLAPGGMWFDVLDHPVHTPARVRLLVYGGLADSCVKRRPREAQYNILQDNLPMWRMDGCTATCTTHACATGCVSRLCKVCAHMAGACGTAVTVRDTVRHMALECPRAALLLDALGRAYARAVGWHVEPGRKCEHLLQEIGAAMQSSERDRR